MKKLAEKIDRLTRFAAAITRKMMTVFDRKRISRQERPVLTPSVAPVCRTLAKAKASADRAPTLAVT